MVTDAILNALMTVVDWVADMLPDHDPDWGTAEAISEYVADLDSLVPVAGPVKAAVALLLFGVVFVGVRLIIVVRHIVLP